MHKLIDCYLQYETALSKAQSAASPLAGAFSMGDDPRKAPCNPIFYDAVENWAKEFLTEHPTPEAAYAAATWIVEYPHAHRNTGTYWYAYAAQKHALCLVPLLNPEDAQELVSRMQEFYPRQDWLPVQEQMVQALRKQAGINRIEKKQQPRGLFLKRLFLLLIGLVIAHTGVAFFLMAELGSDPFNVMIQGLQRMLGFATHGTIHAAVSLFIVLVLLVVDRSYVRIGTFVCMLLGGPIIDGLMLLLGGLVTAQSAMAIRIAAVVAGCCILAVGMSFVIESQAGTGPNDLVAVVISDKTKWKFGPVRIAVDVIFALTGLLLGGTAGIGTLACVLLVGPVAQFVRPFAARAAGHLTQPRCSS